MQNHHKTAGRKRKQFISLTLLLLLLAITASPATAGLDDENIPLYLRQLEEYVHRLKEEGIKQSEDEINREDLLLSHVVQPGETLTRLARRYETTVEKLMEDNFLANPNYIVIGDELNILTIEGLLHKTAEGETINQLAVHYGADPEKIKSYNNLDLHLEKESFEAGKVVIVPGGDLIRRDPLPLSSRGFDTGGSPSFIWPVEGVVTSVFGPRWGSFHHGLDIAASYGTTVKASEAGRVELVANGRGYGLYLILDHGAGWQTLYAHNSAVLVEEKQWIGQGDAIARVGVSGNATGPHVHLEMIKDGEKLDPLNYLP